MSDAATAPTGQVLHRAERMMLMMDRALRRMGYSGFGLQYHVWFTNRCNAVGLRETLATLSHRYPVTTARLDESQPLRPMWRFRVGAVSELFETDLDGSTDHAVLQFAERELAAVRPLDEFDPIRFNLVHLADGRDVLVIHFCHVLMDSNAVMLMLEELNRLHAKDASGARIAIAENDDCRAQYLARSSWWKRWRAAVYAIAIRARLVRRTPVMFSRTLAPASQVQPNRLLLKTLDRDATAAIVARVRRVTGFRGMSLALLVSVFRTMRGLVPEQITPDSVFVVSAGMNLRQPGATHPIFRNLASLLRFGVTPDELADRDACLLLLNRTMRQHLARNLDVGTVQLMSLTRYGSASMRKLTDEVMLQQQSLTYGYFGSSRLERDGLCGDVVERTYHAVQSWSPPGLGLVANESGGRLILSVSYTPSTVSPDLAARFVDGLVEDLTSP